MKKLLTISALCFGFTCAFAQTTTTKPAPVPNAQQTAQTPAADPGYKFDKTVHDYGTI
jgi:hypothetical protein